MSVLLCAICTLRAQVIEYQADGQKYQTLSRHGLTVIISHLPATVAGYALVEVSISNGSSVYWTVRPEDMSYVRPGGATQGMTSESVVTLMLKHASANDVIHLVTSYESVLYGIPNMRSTNGYEMRRQGAMTGGASPKLRAAAAASAIVLATERLAPGQSTDGAVFISLARAGKSLTGGHIVFHCEGETFDFNPD